MLFDYSQLFHISSEDGAEQQVLILEFVFQITLGMIHANYGLELWIVHPKDKHPKRTEKKLQSNRGKRGNLDYISRSEVYKLSDLGPCRGLYKIRVFKVLYVRKIPWK